MKTEDIASVFSSPALIDQTWQFSLSLCTYTEIQSSSLSRCKRTSCPIRGWTVVL